MSVFRVDDKAYNVDVTSLKRSAAVMDGEKAGRTLDARMHSDIIGTFYNYSITLNTRGMDAADYDDLYELLTAPVNCHVLQVPYGQSTIEFEAYIANADDALKRIGTINVWADLTLNFIAMEPQRRVT